MSSPNARRAKDKGSASAAGTRTSPRINRNPYASGSASGLINRHRNPYATKNATGPAPLTSGGSSATARSLSFTTPPEGQSRKKDPSTTASGEKRNPAVAKSSQQRKKVKIWDDDDDISVGDDKDEKDIDFVAITDNAMETDHQETMRQDILQGLKLRHRQAFMAKAFPEELGRLPPKNSQVQSAMMKACRPQVELDYIIDVIQNWQVGTEAKNMPPGPARDKLILFRRQNRVGNKYIYQYCTEEVWANGDPEPRTILRKFNKDGTPGRIVVSREQLFEAIDDWHSEAHLGQERTWKFCSKKYANVTQEHVKFYCNTCFVCMKKNPVTKNEKGSRKPIFSKNFRDRFQVDLVDFHKLRKQDPFGVLSAG